MQYVHIGQISKSQGVRGEVKVQLLTEDPQRFIGLKNVFVEKDGGFIPYTVRSAAIRQGAAYISFEGVDDRDSSDALRGLHICVERKDAIALPAGHHFIFDLVGCQVESSDGEALGTLTDVLQYGAADVYVVSGKSGFMVPAIKRLLKNVDTDARKIVLDADVLKEVAVWDED